MATWLNQAKDDSYYGGGIEPFLDRVSGDGFDLGIAAPAPVLEAETDYSNTNIQVAGVDEADIIKTDGEYLYVVNDRKVEILKFADGQFTELTDLSFNSTPTEIFLSGNRLIVFISESRSFAGEIDIPKPEPVPFVEPLLEIDFDDALLYSDYGGGQQVVSAYIYNVLRPHAPELLRKLSIEGSYNTSRLVDDNIYLISNFSSRLYTGEITPSNVIDFLPQVADTLSGDESFYGPVLDCDQITHANEQPTSQFVTVTAVDLTTDATDHEVVVTSAQNVYASKQNVYLANTNYQWDTFAPELDCDLLDRIFSFNSCSSYHPPISETGEHTDIYKFSLDGAAVDFVASTSIEGRLLNQFSMDEYAGDFLGCCDDR